MPEVDIDFEIKNGLSGMNRQVVLALLHLLGLHSKKNCRIIDQCIRAVVGISQSHIPWKTHRFFVRFRFEYTRCPAVFRSNLNTVCKFSVTPVGEQCTFFSGDWEIVSLGAEITEGAYRWVLKTFYSQYENHLSRLFVGTYPRPPGSVFGNSPDGSCALKFWRNGDGTLQSGLVGVEGAAAIPKEETRIPDNSTLAVDIDTLERTLRFSVDGRKVPRIISEICLPAILGVAGDRGGSFVSVSFNRIHSTEYDRSSGNYHRCFR